MFYRILILFFLSFFISDIEIAFSQDKLLELNIIYGKNHIYTVETPEDWFNDKVSAKKAGLACIFYPIADENKKQKNIIFSLGIDKTSENENLNNLINADIKKFNEKYPDLKIDNVPINNFSSELRNGVIYSYSNLTDKFREEVIYVESDNSIFIFSFSSLSEKDYNSYYKVFDKFVASYSYQGNKPELFINTIRK